MSLKSAGQRIRAAVAGWPGVTVGPHRFGGLELRYGRRELGRLHGNALLDIPFPRPVRDELVGSGLLEPHHLLPHSGWVSLRLRRPADLEPAIALLRRSYELAVAQQRRRSRSAPPSSQSR